MRNTSLKLFLIWTNGCLKISYFYLHHFSESRSSSGTTLSVSTCPLYIMRFTICTAVLSEVRVAWCYGVKMGM